MVCATLDPSTRTTSLKEAMFNRPSPETSHPKPLQAKWLPMALSCLALAISIGGHAFTSINTVNITELSSKMDALSGFRASVDEGDSRRERQIQALRAELVRQQGVIKSLQAQLASAQASSTSASALPSGFHPLNDEANRQAALAKTETAPLPNGVNDQFDRAIRERIKQFWVEPPTRKGEHMDDEDVTVLLFQVDRSGAIRDVQVANTSGQIEFDNSVIKAALRMAHIPEIASMSNEAYAKVASFRLAVNPLQLK